MYADTATKISPAVPPVYTQKFCGNGAIFAPARIFTDSAIATTTVPVAKLSQAVASGLFATRLTRPFNPCWIEAKIPIIRQSKSGMSLKSEPLKSG